MPAFPTSSHRASAGPRWLSDTAIRRDVRAKPVSLPDLATRPGWAFGVYVHVPFCATRRGYSDFNTYTPAELGAANPDGWLAAVRAELGLAAVRLGAPPTADTVFVGGGTPHRPLPETSLPDSRPAK